MPILEAPFVRILGLNIVMFRLFNVGLTLIAALALWAVAKRISGRWGAAASAAVFFLFPPDWVRWSTREYVWWISGTLVGLLVAYCCLRWHDTQRDAWLWPAGFFSGLLFWTYPLFGCLVAPPILAVAWLLRHRVRALFKLVALAPIGAAPWLRVNLLDGFMSFKQQDWTTDPVLMRLDKSMTQVLPTAYITRLVHLSPTSAGVLGGLMVSAVGVLILYALFRKGPAVALVGATILIWPVILAWSRVAVGFANYHYAFVVLAPIAVLTGWMVRRSISLTLLLMLVAVGLSVVGLWRDTHHFAAVGMKDPASKALETRLITDHRTHVYAGYWVSYALSVETGERITASPTVTERYEPYERLAASAPMSTYVFTVGQTLDQAVDQSLERHGGGRRSVIGDYAVYEFDVKVSPAQLPVQSSI